MKKEIVTIAVLSTLLSVHSALSAIGPVDKVPEKPTFECSSNDGDKLTITHKGENGTTISLVKKGETFTYETGYTSKGSKHYKQYAYAMFQPDNLEVVKSSLMGRGGGQHFETISANIKLQDYENYFNCN